MEQCSKDLYKLCYTYKLTSIYFTLRNDISLAADSHKHTDMATATSKTD